jgi:hypothetical protein
MSGHRREPPATRRAGGAIARRLWGADAPLRRALRWLFAGREHIDQEGLLAERTLLICRHHPAAEDPAAGASDDTDRRRTEQSG